MKTLNNFIEYQSKINSKLKVIAPWNSNIAGSRWKSLCQSRFFVYVVYTMFLINTILIYLSKKKFMSIYWQLHQEKIVLRKILWLLTRPQTRFIKLTDWEKA